MPWKVVTPREEIIRFVSLANSGRFSLLELCEDFVLFNNLPLRNAFNGVDPFMFATHRMTP